MAAFGTRRLGAVGDRLLIGLIVALGAVLRLADPLSSVVIPAEDPYNHMALVREHVRRGEIDSLNPQGDVYPPGLHAYLVTVWVHTGADLYWMFRFGPVVLGAVSVLGVCLLLRRFEGRVASLVGGLAMAVAPEEIFRTSMMSPTALNLALLPFLMYAVLEILGGHLRWAAVAGPLLFFYVFAHPWILGLLAATGVVFLVLFLVLPWSAQRAAPLSAPGVAAVAALLGGSLTLALTRCNGLCGPAFANVGGIPFVDQFALVAPVVLAATALATWMAATGARRLARWLERLRGLTPRTRSKVAISMALGVLLTTATAAAWYIGLPEFVDPARMFGWPILALSAAALILLPFAARPLPNAAAALAVTTFPLVVYNPFQSSFLPHRTAVFLGLAACLLAGIAASLATRTAARAWALSATRRLGHPRPKAWRRPAAVGTVVLLTLTATGGVYAATPDGYQWYRLFNECEFEALRDIAGQLDREPGALHISPDWQSKMVLAALAEDASRIWYKPDFFQSGRERHRLLDALTQSERPVYVTLDRYADSRLHESFLSGAPWEPAGSWCASVGAPIPRIALFLHPVAEGRA